jgi:hypothetical protein
MAFKCETRIDKLQPDLVSEILRVQQATVTTSSETAKSGSDRFPMPCSLAERQKGHSSLVLMARFCKLMVSRFEHFRQQRCDSLVHVLVSTKIQLDHLWSNFSKTTEAWGLGQLPEGMNHLLYRNLRPAP